MDKKIYSLLEGYAEIEKEIGRRRKDGTSCVSQKGIWREAVERLHPKRLQLRVTEIRKELDSVVTLRLVALGRHLPPFQAGQYINVLVDINGVHTGRPYSISSAPNQNAYYEITVKRVPHGFVSDYLLDRVRVGDLLSSTGPAGHLYYNPLFHGKNLVFLAGGSGITPFMSMIREATDRGVDRKIHLLYGCRTPQEAIFHEELTARAKIHANFIYDLVISEPSKDYKGLTGFMDAALIKGMGIAVESSMFYLCGPRDMYVHCVPELQKLGIPWRRIRQEVFGEGARVCEDAAWQSDIAPDKVFAVSLSDGRKISACASESLMVAMERAGMVVDNCCRSGECSLCRMQIVSGKVFQPSCSLVRKSDRENGYVHACSTYPLSNLEVRL
jgi:glycine betaine catabolism B